MLEKETLVQNFIRDTFSARGRSYQRILEQNISNDSMTSEEFIEILRSLSFFDKVLFYQESGEVESEGEFEQFCSEMAKISKEYFNN